MFYTKLVVILYIIGFVNTQNNETELSETIPTIISTNKIYPDNTITIISSCVAVESDVRNTAGQINMESTCIDQNVNVKMFGTKQTGIIHPESKEITIITMVIKQSYRDAKEMRDIYEIGKTYDYTMCDKDNIICIDDSDDSASSKIYIRYILITTLGFMLVLIL